MRSSHGVESLSLSEALSEESGVLALLSDGHGGVCDCGGMSGQES